LTEGERWTREQLELLLAAGFSPLGIARFLIASQRRAGETRRARPDLAAQARRWMAVGVAGWLLPAAAGAQPFRRRLSWGLGWWGATAVMLDWHLGMIETEDGRPRRLGPADAMTLLRVWLVPVAADRPAPLVCSLALATDGLDGALARSAEPTRIGRDLEGLADTCFAAAALHGAVRRRWLHRSVAAAELGRLGIGFGYALWVYFGRAHAPDPQVVRAARLTTPIRTAGLVAAGTGRRRSADVLVGAGAVWSVLAVARAVRTVHDKRPTPGTKRPVRAA